MLFTLSGDPPVEPVGNTTLVAAAQDERAGKCIVYPLARRSTRTRQASRAHDVARPYGHARSARRGSASRHIVSRSERRREGSRLTYLPYGPYSDPAVFKASIAAKAQLNDALFFAIRDNSTGKAVGRQAFHRIEPTHRVIEVGHILYTPGMQRTIGATEAQYLFAAYTFDALGYRRCEWRCDDLNAPPKRAAARFGFKFEGVFRQHMIVKGRNRDTAWFSMLELGEWPTRRATFERWLDPANFDAAGRQKVSLTSLNAG